VGENVYTTEKCLTFSSGRSSGFSLRGGESCLLAAEGLSSTLAHLEEYFYIYKFTIKTP
jgi:hypothetical protein